MPLFHRLRFAPIALLLFLSACIADDLSKLQNPSWEPEVALPLVDSRFGIDRIISKFEDGGFLTTEANGLIVVVYNKELFSIDADSIFELEDFMFDLALLQQLGDVNYSAAGSYALKTLELANGDLRLHVEDNTPADVKVTLNMPKSKKGGVAFSESFIVPFNGNTPIVFDTIIDLSGYRIDLSGDGTEKNKLSINYTAERLSGGANVELDEFLVAFENMDYEYLDGYLGELDFGSFDDTLKIDAFKNFKSGRILLQNPEVNFLVDNGFGMPISITFNGFSGTGPGGESDLDSDVLNDGINVDAPSNPGDTTSSKSTINDANSNLSQFLSITPGQLNFTLGMRANAGTDSNTMNFISKSSILRAEIDLKMPLRGSLDSVIIEDLYDFTVDDLKKADEVEFRLFTKNAFPLGIYLQIYFVDDNGVVLDSLIQDNDVIFREALTGPDGFSVQAMDESSQFTIGESRFGLIKDRTKQLKVRAMLLTDASSQKVVSIRNTDYFDIKLGVRAIIKN